MTNVAERLIETLSAAGVSRIYGLVGDSLNAITDSLRRHEAIRWVQVRHEEVAAFAAGADAAMTGQLASGERIGRARTLGVDSVRNGRFMEKTAVHYKNPRSFSSIL
jgi:glyoxylate carboligase